MSAEPTLARNRSVQKSSDDQRGSCVERSGAVPRRHSVLLVGQPAGQPVGYHRADATAQHHQQQPSDPEPGADQPCRHGRDTTNAIEKVAPDSAL